MAAEVAGWHYRTWYAKLLQLYPRPFRERFGEGMAQTFHDLCREHSEARRGLYGLALWIFFETSVGIVRENTTHMSQLGKTMLRVALGALAALNGAALPCAEYGHRARGLHGVDWSETAIIEGLRDPKSAGADAIARSRQCPILPP